MAITKSDGKFFRHLSHGAVILKLRSPAFAALTAALTSALLFSGCNPEAAEKVDQLTVFSGGGQYALPGGDFAIFEEYQTALGVETIINHVGDCFD